MPEQLADLDPDVQQSLRDLLDEGYPPLLVTFRADIERRQADLHHALIHADWQALRRAAHSLRGSCADMGALALQEACADAEAAASQGNSQSIAQCCAVIDQLCQRLQRQLLNLGAK